MNLPKFFSGEIRIDPESLHWRLYRWWRQNSADSYQAKDFCAYFWAVVLWAPTYWFFNGRLWKGYRPVTLVSVVSLPMFLIIGLWLWTALTLQIIFLIGVLCACGLFVWALIKTFIWLDSHRSGMFRRVLIVLFKPVTVPIGLLFDGIDQLIENGWVDWYIKTRKWVVVTPWSATLVLLFFISWATLGLATTLLFVRIIATMIGTVGVVALVLVGTIWFVDSYDKRRRRQRMEAVFREMDASKNLSQSQGSSWLQILWHGLLSWKRKVCPLVQLPEELSPPWDEFELDW